MSVSDFLQFELLGSPVRDYGVAIATLLIGLLAISLTRHVVLGRLKFWASRTATDLDDRLLHLVEPPVIWLLYLGTLFISIQDLIENPEFPGAVGKVITALCLVVGTVLAIHLICSLLEYGLRFYWVTRRSDVFMEQTLKALIPALKVVVWTVGLIFLLDNLGLDVSAAVTSLGIGGVALALASQGILADMFGYFAILFDRPFEIGDFITTGDFSGTIETVGLKTTRIRSISGEELIIPNTDLAAARIQNYKRMARRRIVFTLKVPYETPANTLATLPELIRQVVETTEKATFDRAHFHAYGDFGLVYEVVYFVESSDYKVYMDIQQSINLAIKNALQQHGIALAHQLPWFSPAAERSAANGERNNHQFEGSVGNNRSSPTAT
ncbi:MAG TPA: mechanosensitive ion channel family protein [Trichocoleus sp.]